MMRESEPIPFVPPGNLAIRLQRCKSGSFEPAFAMHENALVLFQMAQFVGFDFVLFDTGVCARGHSAGKATSCLLNFPLSKEIGAFDRAGLVSGFEYHSVAEIQREDLCLFLPQRWNERGGRLRGRHEGRTRLPHYVNAVVVAHALVARGHKSLCFVRP